MQWWKPRKDANKRKRNIKNNRKTATKGKGQSPGTISQRPRKGGKGKGNRQHACWEAFQRGWKTKLALVKTTHKWGL